MNRQSTLCYIEKDGKYLMLHRVVKKNDVNKDKWIGVGGHFEYAESPEECLLREVKEETGYTLTSWKYRGIVTFVYGEDVVEYMSLYTADGFTGDPIECDEGVLEWVEKEKIKDLNLWEGDKIFFRLMDEEEEFFSLKLVYNKSDVLEYVALNGKPMELFDVIDEDGNKTGQVKERGVAHRDGTLHATVHIWIVRPNQESGYDVLLQKRSECKDSNPGAYDISSAGHVSAGDELMESALREMEEELIVNLKKSEFLVAMATDPEDPTKVNIPYLKNKQGDILQPAFTDVMEFEKFGRGKNLRVAKVTIDKLPSLMIPQANAYVVNPMGFNLVLNKEQIEKIAGISK